MPPHADQHGVPAGPLSRTRLPGIQKYSLSMADTTIKITGEARDRLRQLAEERGVSARAYVERLIATTPTEAERAERTARAVSYVRSNLRPDLSDDDVREAALWRAAITTGQVGGRR